MANGQLTNEERVRQNILNNLIGVQQQQDVPQSNISQNLGSIGQAIVSNTRTLPFEQGGGRQLAVIPMLLQAFGNISQGRQQRQETELTGLEKQAGILKTVGAAQQAASQQQFQQQMKLQAQQQAQAKTNFSQAKDLRNSFVNQSKVFVNVRDAFNRIQASAQDPSAAGDLALIFNFMKVLDPGSTVREGEFATAQNSAGLTSRLRAQYNGILRGERLDSRTRNDFVNRSELLFKRQRRSHDLLTDEFTRLSNRFGIDPRGVIVDFTNQITDADIQEIVSRAEQGDQEALVQLRGLRRQGKV